MTPESMLFDSLIPSLEEVGARFERGDFFVPEMLIAGRAMSGALDLLRPLLAETGVETVGTFVMGTVKGDVHDIGKNLVNIMLEGAGFHVIDLGVQVPPEKFVEAINEHKPDIVGFSAFLTTTMPMFKANINALEKAGLRDQVVVMVGGAPVTQEYADAVGADAYAADASADGQEGQRPDPAQARSRLRLIATPAVTRIAVAHPRLPDEEPAVCTPSSALPPSRSRIGHDQPFCIIGERINPTGRRIFQEQLRAGDLSAIERDVAAQVAGGAMVLDVNMGVPLTDEPELLKPAIKLIQSLTDLPICIDSSVVEALEAGLSVYEGAPLVNSITAEDDRMAAILPMVKHYGAAVVALPNDHDEIPMEADKRLELTKKILDTAVDKYGLALEDIVIDPLAMPIGADPNIVNVAYETISRIRDEFGAQHDRRRVQRLVRHAWPPHDQRHLPADGDDGRADQRDHGRPHAADRRGGQGRRPAPRPRRVGRQLDRRVPCQAGC